ncbi:MAG: substrate-binding domain-containing protein [Chloroflexi bacterium]|nr:substrate-binding domain-containing protein [Chloroflexota bacterium]
MKSRSLIAVAASAAILVGACAGATPSSPASSNSSAAATSGASPSAAVATSGASPSAAGKRLKIGFVVHVKGNPFIQSIIASAQDAANDLDVDLVVAGPEGFDAEAQLKNVQDLFAAGADGVSTSIPGETMTAPLNQLIADGHPIVTFNINSTNLEAPFVGEDSIPAWSRLGEAVANKLGADATGKVILGTCAPQLPVLVQRGEGVVKGLAAVAPGLKPQGPFDVKVDPVVNYQAWEQLAAANPDAKAMVGLCAPDPENLGKLNAANGDKFVTAGGDFTAGNMKAIADGHTLASIGQGGYVQGYLPIKMLVEHIRDGAPLTKGLLSSGVELMTKEGATFDYDLPQQTFADAQAIFTDQAKAKVFYAPLFAPGGPMSTEKWATLIQPYAAAQ